ncbi:MAG: preprotein translocase subunit YajC [Oscillospiraceae bacterium]|nr:preprotein translocase subunit YajC [Oscillospiraceae bacterium]
MNNFLFALSSAADANAEAAMGGMSIFTMIIPLAVMVLIFWLFIIRPEKKRNKEMQNMLENLQVADEVVTTGGIVGLVVSVSKDTVLIETGSDRTKIRVMKSSIAKNNTQREEEPKKELEAKNEKSDKKDKKKDKPEIK